MENLKLLSISLRLYYFPMVPQFSGGNFNDSFRDTYPYYRRQYNHDYIFFFILIIYLIHSCSNAFIIKGCMFFLVFFAFFILIDEIKHQYHAFYLKIFFFFGNIYLFFHLHFFLEEKVCCTAQAGLRVWPQTHVDSASYIQVGLQVLYNHITYI